jgi:hypothetical protein
MAWRWHELSIKLKIMLRDCELAVAKQDFGSFLRLAKEQFHYRSGPFVGEGVADFVAIARSGYDSRSFESGNVLADPGLGKGKAQFHCAHRLAAPIHQHFYDAKARGVRQGFQQVRATLQNRLIALIHLFSPLSKIFLDKTQY